MKIDDVDEVEKFLDDVKYFFSYIDTEKDRLEKEQKIEELKTEDLLHEIELVSLNVVDRNKIYTQLKESRMKRRVIKDKLDFVNTLRGYTSKFITKGICAETNQVIENIGRLKKEWEKRTYTPRILKDLKCAKLNKKEGEEKGK